MTTPTFQFTSSAYAADTFTVVDFQGSEAISSLYRFEIGLKSDLSNSIDLRTLLGGSATLTLQGQQGNSYSGILARVEQQQQAGGYNYFRVVLVPPAWKLSLNTRSAAFVGMTFPAIVEQVLENAGLTCGTAQTAPNADVSTDDLTVTYPERDYTCQYAETDLDFISRLMEYEGIYFYFVEQSGASRMVLADGMAYPNAVPVPFTDPSSTNNYDSITQISQRLQDVTTEVSVTGYDYLHSVTPVEGSYGIAVDNHSLQAGYPSTWLYDHRTPDSEDAARVAQLRAQEDACWACTFSGSGALPGLRAGSTFSLSGHPVSAFNREYLVTSVTHSARNADQSWVTTSYTAGQAATGGYYGNSFTAVPAVAGQAGDSAAGAASMQFRPRRRTPKPSINGLLSAIVYLQQDDGGAVGAVSGPLSGYEGASASAEANENAFALPSPPMDDQGRYLVILPFVDATVTNGSPVSAWVRMAQPTAGLWTGTNFMLEPGAEVLLAFVNGDPDLPVIVGAVYNGAIPAPLTSANINPQI